MLRLRLRYTEGVVSLDLVVLIFVLVVLKRPVGLFGWVRIIVVEVG
jgi:hypothetical protein